MDGMASLVVVGQSSVAEIEASPEFAAMAPAYAAESQIEGMPPANPQWETYRAMESLGLLHVFSAMIDGKLIGYLSLLVATLPRYGVPIVVSESYFVAKEHRKTGAGLRLLEAAEEKTRALGATVILVSAPIGGDLAKVLPRRGYVEGDTVFLKKVA